LTNQYAMNNREGSGFDVAVVGGGVVGLAIAWRAAQRGLRVVVLERHEPGGGASWVAAGMLAPVTETRLTELPLLELGIASAQAYPKFVAQLRAVTDIDPGYQRVGTLMVARDRDEAEALERELEVRRSLNLEVARLRPTEARQLEPALAPTVRLALEVPDDHAIDPRPLTHALADAARAAGAQLRTGVQVHELVRAEDQVTGVRLLDGTRVDAQQVVIAAGAWTSGLDGIPEEDRIAINPVKGQLLRLHDPSGPGLVERVLRVAGTYLVPRGDGRYVLGATMEERGYDTTVTAGALFELLRDAAEVVPGISELVIDELIAGLRPATADGLPAIGAARLAGLHWAVGHFRNGILLTPVTADIVVAGLVGDTAPEVAASVDPARLRQAAEGQREAGRRHSPSAPVGA
jgi:glycine oxidase